MSLRVRVTAAAACCVLALSACGGGDTETDGTGPSDGGGNIATPAHSDGGESTGASETPAPDPADFPGMDQNTPEGAEQAFRFYYASVFFAYQTARPEVIEGLASDECAACSSQAETALKLRDSSGSWGPLDIEDVDSWSESSEFYDIEASYLFVIPPHDEFDSDARRRVAVPRAEYVARGGLAWEGDRWVVVDLAASWSADEHDKQ